MPRVLEGDQSSQFLKRRFWPVSGLPTRFHSRFVSYLSLQLDHFMPGTSTVRVAFNAKPLYFSLRRRCVMNNE
jgi:hypothetical protein